MFVQKGWRLNAILGEETNASAGRLRNTKHDTYKHDTILKHSPCAGKKVAKSIIAQSYFFTEPGGCDDKGGAREVKMQSPMLRPGAQGASCVGPGGSGWSGTFCYFLNI